MKYIDAEKLKAEIERRRLSNRYIDTEGYEAELFEIIDSLQQEQKPAEWSEEDEAMRDNILRLLSCFFGTLECVSNPSLSTSYPAYQKEIDWLKSLNPTTK